MGAAASEEVDAQMGSEPVSENTTPGRYSENGGGHGGANGGYGGGNGGAAVRPPAGQYGSYGGIATAPIQPGPYATYGGGNGGTAAPRPAAPPKFQGNGSDEVPSRKEAIRERISSATDYAKKQTREVVSNKTNQVVAASGLGGAVVVGAAGAGAGLLTGGAAGAAIGLLPALFTFGLSIPFGAVIGATCGTVVGATAGGTVGLTGGSAVGYVAWKKRTDIRTFVVHLNMKIGTAITRTKIKVSYYADLTKTKVVDTCTKTFGSTKEKVTRIAQNATARTKKLVANKDVQRAAASGAAGAAALGVGGAAAGAVTGGAVGAAVGLVPTLFTFGLSIPFCAVVGGGCGLAAGATAGGTAGAAVGVGGYATYTKREAIRQGIRSTIEKAGKTVGSVADQVKQKMS